LGCSVNSAVSSCLFGQLCHVHLRRLRYLAQQREPQLRPSADSVLQDFRKLRKLLEQRSAPCAAESW
jgi:hypothetical protein